MKKQIFTLKEHLSEKKKEYASQSLPFFFISKERLSEKNIARFSESLNYFLRMP